MEFISVISLTSMNHDLVLYLESFWRYLRKMSYIIKFGYVFQIPIRCRSGTYNLFSLLIIKIKTFQLRRCREEHNCKCRLNHHAKYGSKSTEMISRIVDYYQLHICAKNNFKYEWNKFSDKTDDISSPSSAQTLFR